MQKPDDKAGGSRKRGPQLNVPLPDDMHREFKAHCARNDRKMVDVIQALIARVLAGEIPLD